DDNIYAVKKGSPLVVGKGKNGLCVCSDVVGASNFSKTYAVVPNERIIKISGKKVTQYTFQKVSEKITFSLCERTENYESTGEFMLKEIHEIPLLTRLFGLKAEEWRGDIISPDLLVGVTEIYLVGCGTAYNSCLVAKSVLTRHTKLCVQCFYASEFCYSQLPLSDHILTVAVSQSGETADTLKAVGVARDAGSKVVAITNVKNSSLSFVADCVLYIGAGREVAVASTKAYNLQVLTLILLSLKIALMREEISQYYFDEKCSILKDLSATVSATFSCESVVKEIADALAVAKSVFYLGRLSDYATAVEGSLKLKEISYIYSDAYPAGELKHGTLALVEKGVVCVIIATNRALLDKVQSTIAEVSARGASTIAVTPFVDEIVADKVIKLPITDEIFYPMISIIPLQLLAYYTALARGADIDKPRNLAKSVTVE
ncbi:MAG: isomerizing glutamine--fructose-6-phosphate transaminase, partial [Clostridia bacterium]